MYLQVPGLNIRIYEKKQKEKTLTGLKAGSDSYLDRKMWKADACYSAVFKSKRHFGPEVWNVSETSLEPPTHRSVFCVCITSPGSARMPLDQTHGQDLLSFGTARPGSNPCGHTGLWGWEDGPLRAGGWGRWMLCSRWGRQRRPARAPGWGVFSWASQMCKTLSTPELLKTTFITIKTWTSAYPVTWNIINCMYNMIIVV